MSADAPDPQPPPLPERVGKYPVVRKLGEGATSEVYLCRDPFNDREVAVKRIFPEALRDIANLLLFVYQPAPDAGLEMAYEDRNGCGLADN